MEKFFRKTIYRWKQNRIKKFFWKIFFSSFFSKKKNIETKWKPNKFHWIGYKFFLAYFVVVDVVLKWTTDQTENHHVIHEMNEREREKKKVLFCPKGKIIYVMRFVSKMWNYSNQNNNKKKIPSMTGIYHFFLVWNDGRIQIKICSVMNITSLKTNQCDNFNVVAVTTTCDANWSRKLNE